MWNIDLFSCFSWLIIACCQFHMCLVLGCLKFLLGFFIVARYVSCSRSIVMAMVIKLCKVFLYIRHTEYVKWSAKFIAIICIVFFLCISSEIKLWVLLYKVKALVIIGIFFIFAEKNAFPCSCTFILTTTLFPFFFTFIFTGLNCLPPLFIYLQELLSLEKDIDALEETHPQGEQVR